MSVDGSRYFPKEFDVDSDAGVEEPEEVKEPDRVKFVDLKELDRARKKSRKKDRKEKEPVRLRGYDAFMSSISQAVAHGSRPNPGVEESTPVTVRPDRRNVPSGVLFNRTKDFDNKRDKASGKGSKEQSRRKKGSNKGTKGTEGASEPDVIKNRGGTSKNSRKRSPSISSTLSGSSSTDSNSTPSSSTSSTSSSDSESQPSTSSDSSLSSPSSEESDSEQSKKRKSWDKEKKRTWKKKRHKEERILKRVKIDAPSPYNGKADLDVFDKWALEVRTWTRLNKFNEKIVITLLNKYVTGRASIFYMKYVADKERRWTLKAIFEGLFDYCFPKDFKMNLRRKMMNATQGKTRVTEFVRDIEIMADRFPDVNERGIIKIFWNGMNQSIRA